MRSQTISGQELNLSLACGSRAAARRAAAIVVLLAMGLAPGLRSHALADPDSHHLARITYIAADGVYLDAGSALGIEVGDSLPVLRDRQQVAVIVVRHVASQSAAAAVASASSPLHVGDAVQIRTGTAVVLAGSADVARQSESRIAPAVSQRRTTDRIRGEIVLQQLWNQDLTGAGISWSQPSLRTRIVVAQVGGTSASLRVRHLTRLYHRSERLALGRSADEWDHRVIELALIQDARGSASQWGVGRVMAQDVRGMGYIDGGFFTRQLNPSYRVGVAAGTVPDYATSGVRLHRKKLGIFGAYETGSYELQRLVLAAALSTEYDRTTVSRDFLYLQGTYSRAGWLSLYQSMEVDLNRDWRYGLARKRFSFTSYYTTISLNVSPAAGLDFSYDARSNPRYFETRDVADSLFDESMHRGVRTGLRLRASDHVNVRANGGWRFGKDGETSNRFASLSLRLSNFPRPRQAMSLNVSMVKTPFTTGYRPVLSYRIPLTRRLPLTFTGTGYIYRTGATTTESYYLDLASSYMLSRSYFLTGSVRQYLDSRFRSVAILLELGAYL